jgi:hypothetical protein
MGTEKSDDGIFNLCLIGSGVKTIRPWVSRARVWRSLLSIARTCECIEGKKSDPLKIEHCLYVELLSAHLERTARSHAQSINQFSAPRVSALYRL